MHIPFEVEPPSNEKKKLKGSASTSIKRTLSNEISSSVKINQPISVSQLTKKISNLLENELQSLTIEGELSNVKLASSGHLYFILKDDQSQIRGVMFRQFIPKTAFEPENGLEVIVRGSVSVYKQRGEYQIIISSIEPKGFGALQLAFEQLKTKLESEGLFEEKYKQKIPFLPRSIGIVTSPTGAVIHDMIKVLEHRFSNIPILIFPVQVQGELAAASIIEGIQYLNSISKSKNIDVLIIGRGGGSIEDLWAFNDEKLARTIFSSNVPVISAVGHEIDFTISDFVSDLRAPTPSAAIELAVPKRKDLIYTLEQKKGQLVRLLDQKIERLREYFKVINKNLDSPINIVRQYSQLVDDFSSLLFERKNRYFDNLQKYNDILLEKIFLLNPKKNLLSQIENLELLQKRLKHSLDIYKKDCFEKIEKNKKFLKTLSPISVLGRGYSLTMDIEGKTLTSISEIQIGEKLQVLMKDGKLHTKVLSLEPRKKK